MKLYDHEVEYIHKQMSDPWIFMSSTHLPMLMLACARTDGPILELGCGFSSTPILHEITRDRELLTIECNPISGDVWYRMFAHLESPWHRMAYEHEWKGLPVETLLDKHWSVVLVDAQPAAVRPLLVRLFSQNATYIVAHDTQSEAEDYKWGDVFDEFKYRLDYKLFPAWTTVVSNERALIEDVGN